MEGQPASVPDAAKHVGDARGRWPWAEPSVWTERMLAALEKGVKGGKWSSLIDKVYSEKDLRSSFTRVKASKGSAGVDHHQRWPNACFADRGLFSLAAAYASARRPPLG